MAVGLLLISFPTLFSAEPKEMPSAANEKAEKIWGPTSREVLSLDLRECLQRAMSFSRELQTADQDILTAEEKGSEVRKIGFPILDYEYNLGPAPKDASNATESFFSGDLTVFNRIRLGLGVPLQTFGKVKTGKQLSLLGIEAEKQKKVLKKSEIALKIHQLYYGILLAREIRHLISMANDQLTKEIEKREGKGGGDPTELLKLKLFHAELDRRAEESDKREMMAREALRILVDVDPLIRFDIKATRLLKVGRPLAPYDSYEKEAVGHRSDLKQLDIYYQVRERQVALEKRLPTPNLGIGAFFELGHAPGVHGLTTTDDFTDPFNFTRAGFGLRLTGQLDFHGSAAKIRQARSELFKVEIQRSLAREGALLDVKGAYLEVRNSQQEIDRAEEAGKLSRQLLFITQSNFDIGLSEGKEIIDAIQSFLETRGKYFEAVFNYDVSVAKLDQTIGRIPE